MRDAAAGGFHVRDHVRGDAHPTEEVEEVEQIVPRVLQMGHRREDVHRVDHEQVDLLPLVPSDEEVLQDAEPIPDLLDALPFDPELRDVHEEVVLLPQAQMSHRPQDRIAALFDGHVDAAPSRGPILQEDVEGQGGLHRAAGPRDREDAAPRDAALQERVEAPDERREAFIDRRGAGRRGRECCHLLPQPPDLIPQLPEFPLELLRCPRDQSGLRGLNPLDAHSVRHSRGIYGDAGG